MDIATYRFIVEEGMKDIGKDRRKWFKKRGLSKRDIILAHELMACIVFLDNNLFPDEKIPAVHWVYNKCRASAAYNDPIDGGFSKESYSVKIPGLCKDFERRQEVMLFDDQGFFSKIDFASRQESILSIAAHENRHRYHCRGGKMFSPGEERCSKRMKLFIGIEETSFEKRKYLYVDKNGNPSLQEFDAYLIQRVFLNAIHYNNLSIEKMLSIIRMEPQG